MLKLAVVVTLVAAFALSNLSSYRIGFLAGWDAVECVDVTDADQFVGLRPVHAVQVQQAKRPPFQVKCFYWPSYTIADHLNSLSTFDAAEVKVVNANCLLTRF